MRGGHLPSQRAEAPALGVIGIEIHRKLEDRLGHPFREIHVRGEGGLLGVIAPLTADHDVTVPIPLADRREAGLSGRARLRLRLEEFRVDEGKVTLPGDDGLWEACIDRIHAESDRPELVMAGLPHLHLIHPVEDLGRVEAAEQAAAEEIGERRLDRVTEVQQEGMGGEFAEFLERHSVNTHPFRMMLLGTSPNLRRAEQKAVLETVEGHPASKTPDT